MPVPKPAELPQWASEDEIDQTSGQYNVVEPPLERKRLGWYLGEKPNRQWWNWLHRTTYDWLAYFNDNLDFDADTIVPVWQGLTVQPTTNYFYYSKEGDRIYFTCHIIWSGNADTTNALEMTNLPYPGKNAVGLLQMVPVLRGAGPTAPNGNLLGGLIGAGSSSLQIYQNDLTTGLGSPLTSKNNVGQLILTGFYFTDS